jgi:transcriptional regulator with XRE-family HTH domain
MSFNYKMLKLKIKEVYETQEAFAEAMGMSYTALNQRLNNVVQWKTPEIAKACELLHIPLTDAHLYFFTLEV